MKSKQIPEFSSFIFHIKYNPCRVSKSPSISFQFVPGAAALHVVKTNFKTPLDIWPFQFQNYAEFKTIRRCLVKLQNYEK